MSRVDEDSGTDTEFTGQETASVTSDTPIEGFPTPSEFKQQLEKRKHVSILCQQFKHFQLSLHHAVTNLDLSVFQYGPKLGMSLDQPLDSNGYTEFRGLDCIENGCDYPELQLRVSLLVESTFQLRRKILQSLTDFDEYLRIISNNTGTSVSDLFGDM